MIKEIFVPINGYEGLYEISNLGNVKSLRKERLTNKYGTKKQLFPERILKNELTPRGYYRVMISKFGDKKKVCVHRLVCEAFHENPYKKQQVNHKNGLKTDNRVENLEWMTQQENIAHYHKNKR